MWLRNNTQTFNLPCSKYFLLSLDHETIHHHGDNYVYILVHKF